MLRNFEASNKFLLQDEQGYSDDPRDPGNWFGGKLVGSNMGVTPGVLHSFSPQAPITAESMKNLSPTVQALIAQKLYWTPVSGDRLPDGIDLMAFDFGYNAGPGTSCRILNQALGLPPTNILTGSFFVQVVKPNVNRVLDLLNVTTIKALQSLLGVTVDGLAGPATRQACVANPYNLRVLLLLSVKEKQDQRYQSLGNSVYLRGWLNRTEDRFQAALNLPTVKALR